MTTPRVNDDDDELARVLRSSLANIDAYLAHTQARRHYYQRALDALNAGDPDEARRRLVIGDDQ